MMSQRTQPAARHHDRFEISRNAALTVSVRRSAKPSAEWITATPHDVSPSGVKLATPDSLGFGEEVELHFEGGHESNIDFTIVGIVRWIRQREDEAGWCCGCSIGSDCTDAWFQELATVGYVERRAGERIRSDATATFKLSGAPGLLTACILDYSSHGVCLATSEPIGSDRPLVIMIQQDGGEPVTLRARSRWEVAFESGYMVGCELYPEDRNPQIPECSTADPMAKTHIMEKLVDEYNDDEPELNLNNEVVLDSHPLLETIDQLIDEIDTPTGARTNDTVSIAEAVGTTATQPLPAFEPLPANDTDHELPLVLEVEPVEDVSLKAEPRLENAETQPSEPKSGETEQPPNEAALLVDEVADATPQYEVTVENETLSEPACEIQPKAKPKPRKRSFARSIGLFLLIEVALGGYFGAFYLNWDRSQQETPASTDAPRSYHYLQNTSEIIFYPAAKFESLFECGDSTESR